MKKVLTSAFVLMLLVAAACTQGASPPPANTPAPVPQATATQPPATPTESPQATATTPPATPTEVPEPASPLDASIEGIGGEDALNGLSSLVIEASVIRRARGEGPNPDFVPGPDISMSWVSSHDISEDNLRIDVVRPGQNPKEYSEILAGDLGYMTGTDANFGSGDGSNIASDRMASSRKHYRLTNPHLILLNALNDSSIASDGGTEQLNGVKHNLIVIEDEVAPITLFVNSKTGLISKLETMEHDHWLRDVETEVVYEDWQEANGGIMIPHEVSVNIEGETMYEESRGSVQANASLDSGLFDFPDGADPTFDAELAAYGNATSQTLQMFSARGFPQRVLMTFIDPQEIAPGIFHLRGSSHNSLVIEQENGIVISEAPLYPERSEAVIVWVEGEFPDKPITHVISSHHHRDHSSGLRSYVAKGIIVVINEQAEDVFIEVFSRPSTIIPDELAENPADPIFELVPDGGVFEIADSNNTVMAFSIAPGHASDTLFTYAADGGVVFMGDGNQQVPELREALETEGFAPSLYAGGHGQASEYE